LDDSGDIAGEVQADKRNTHTKTKNAFFMGRRGKSTRNRGILADLVMIDRFGIVRNAQGDK
jgi:hypothetical protein